MQTTLSMEKMTREEAMSLLKSHIPSFERKFNDEEYYGKDGWLFMDERVTLPPVIPEDFYVGKTYEYKGVTLTSIQYRDTKSERVEREYYKEPEGRRIHLSYLIFPGHPHMYPKLEVDGVATVQKGDNLNNDKEFLSFYLPDDKTLSHHWEITPMRILPQEDVDKAPYEWEFYKAGDRTNRFLDLREMYLTAAYVCLSRIQGPFFLTDKSRYDYKRPAPLVVVDKNGVVTFSEEMKRLLCG